MEQRERLFQYDSEEGEDRGDRTICGRGQEHVLNAGLLKRAAPCVFPHTKPLTTAFPGTIVLSAHVFPVFHMCIGGLLLVRRDLGADLERTAEPR